MSDPFHITGPALISFSGGRTSAYMLWRILQAHGGMLPDDVYVVFANTGKEREETLRFVHECGSRWNIHVRWIEMIDYVAKSPSADRFAEVGYNSASRNGEPFAILTKRKNYLPNALMRFCTIELKIRAMRDFMKAQGIKNWTNVIGLRADEQHRVIRSIETSLSGKQPWKNAHPLNNADISQKDVLSFWAAQDFDLGLRHYEGNCDLCFLKGRGKLRSLIRENPGMADWWIEQERQLGATFNKEWSYQGIKNEVRDQGFLFDVNEGLDINDEHDAECGTWCAGEAA